MAIANEKVIQKMMEELKQAKENQHHYEKMINHIEKVYLLCELFLDDDTSKTISSILEDEELEEPITPEEMKAMLGENNKQKKNNKTLIKHHNEANGDSIFDF